MKQTEDPNIVASDRHIDTTEPRDMGWIEEANEALHTEGQRTVEHVRLATKDVLDNRRQRELETAPIPLAS